VYAAPIGTKVAPDCKDKNNLISLGWKEVEVDRRKYDQTINIQNNTFARRSQFPLHSRVAATIYRAMGSNLNCVVTQVSNTKNDAGYIWDRGQVVVLLSRTPRLSNIYFVTGGTVDKEEVAKTLLYILSKAPQFYNYQKQIIERTGIRFISEAENGVEGVDRNRTSKGIIKLTSYPFRPMDFQLPDDNICLHGYVYILLSLKTLKSVYVGSCKSITARMHEHNHVNSTSKKRIAPTYLRPWALMGFVCAFKSDADMFTFE